METGSGCQTVTAVIISLFGNEMSYRMIFVRKPLILLFVWNMEFISPRPEALTFACKKSPGNNDCFSVCVQDSLQKPVMHRQTSHKMCPGLIYKTRKLNLSWDHFQMTVKHISPSQISLPKLLSRRKRITKMVPKQTHFLEVKQTINIMWSSQTSTLFSMLGTYNELENCADLPL